MSATRKEKEETAIEALHPRNVTELYGHSALETALLERFRTGNLPHAFLITGQEGIGKATFAYRFARFLLAQGAAHAAPEMSLFGEAELPKTTADSFDIPPTHPAFGRVANGSHADLLTIEPAFDEKKGEYKKEISVDQARKIGGFLSMTAAESDWRVVIIDSIDALNRNAANAILKLLEEPPPQAMLLLVSHNPAGLLPTIRSRCQVLTLNPPKPEDFNRILRMYVPDILFSELSALRVLSGDRPGLALRLHAGKAVELYDRLLAFCAAETYNPREMDTVVDRLVAKQPGDAEMIHFLLPFVLARVIKSASGATLTPVTEGDAHATQRIASRKPLDSWLALWDNIQSLLRDAANIYLDTRQVARQLLQPMTSKDHA